MIDAVYIKLTHTELELKLMKLLAESITAFNQIKNRNCYKIDKPLPSGARDYEFLNLCYDQIAAAESVADQAATNILNSLDHDERDLLEFVIGEHDVL